VAIVDVFMSGDGLVPGAKKSRDQGIVISRIEQLDDGREGFRIAWTSTGFSHWQLHSERVMDFVDDGKGGTEYACWETFGGLLATVVKATYGGTLVERFGDYAGDVRGWFEKGEKWKEAPGEGVENGADANGKVLENVTLT
jgi:hypothetical protein